MSKLQIYAINKGDYVAAPDGRKGMALTVGKVGGETQALVKWIDTGKTEFMPLVRLKRTFRVIADPDT